MSPRPANGRRGKRQQPGAARRRWVMPAAILSLALLTGSALAGAYLLLMQPDRLPLRVIEIKGEFRQLDRATIERVVVDNIDGGFFSCDMNKLRKAVLAMPWVDDVSVRRSWPDRLSMVVTEQVPLARSTWSDALAAGSRLAVLKETLSALNADAERRRAELAFLGIESRVFAADVNGRQRYRVYIGPISDLDRLNLLRSQLRAAGIDVLRITVGD